MFFVYDAQQSNSSGETSIRDHEEELEARDESFVAQNEYIVIRGA